MKDKPFTTKDIDKLKKALDRAGAKPTKFYKIRDRKGFCIVK